MRKNYKVSEFDIFFLSYDEPNAEKHWADLTDKCPWAKRVHGVKGFDSAHRRCAEESETPWFITVDADNIVLQDFFDQTIDLDPDTDLKKSFSWNGINMMNGLMYGNGGLKLWSKDFASKMHSHEFAEDKNSVDFCWENNYLHLHKSYSEVWNNGSPYQAFRVGFREGVKLALDRGQRVQPQLMASKLHNVNLRNLRIWCSVGRDMDNGLWSIYGARLGWSYMCDMTYDYSPIRDYDWFDAFWAGRIKDIATDEQLMSEINRLGVELKEKTHIAIPLLDNDTSDFFRETFKYRND